MSTREDNEKIEEMMRQHEQDLLEANRDPLLSEDREHMKRKMIASAPTVVTPADPENEPEMGPNENTI